MTKSLLQAFANADTSGLPPFDGLKDERTQTLWVLALGDKQEQTRYLTASDVSDVLREVFGHVVSRQRVASILGDERKTIHHAKRGTRWVYRIMNPGLAELEALPSSVVFIRPEEALRGIRSVQDIFGTAKGDVSVCDPYVDARTLDLLADFTKATSIRLLTVNVDKPHAFKRDAALLAKQTGIRLEVRIASSKVLHDRYAIHDDGMLLCGTSLDGLGKKQSYVVALPQDTRQVSLAAFNEYWASAVPI